MTVDPTGKQTNVVLLGWIQEYLRNLLSQGSSDSLVVFAWDEFYRIYDSLLRRFARSRGLTGPDVDDCVQAVWMKIAQRLSDFQRPEDRPGFRSWLYTLVRSESCNLLRQRSARQAISLNAELHPDCEPLQLDTTVEDAMEQEWEQALLVTILRDIRDEVSPINWRLLQMQFQQKSDVEEIARELGLEPQQVRDRQRRLFKKLRQRATALTGTCGQEVP